jgi:hypothetical protein
MVKTTHTCGKSGLNIYLFGMKKTYETSLFSLVGRNADYTLHSVEPTPFVRRHPSVASTNYSSFVGNKVRDK